MDSGRNSRADGEPQRKRVRKVNATIRMRTETLRVVVIQPHSLLRQGMISMLEASEDLQVVAHTGSAPEGMRFARDLGPDIVIVDLDTDEEEADRLIATLKGTLNGLRVLAMAERATPGQVERALGEGADGYTLKGVTTQEFAASVRQVASGQLSLHPAAAAILARSFTDPARIKGGDASGLTPRQREIIQMLALGLQNKQIARRLGIGVETVKTHISRILERLGASSRTEAVVVALRDGFLD